jgi:integrase
MPRLIRALPKLRLHKASGQARVRYQDREYYLGPYGSQEAKAAYARFIENLGSIRSETKTAPQPALEANLLVGELVLKFTAFADQYYKRTNGEPTGEACTIRHALRPLVELFAETFADQFGPLKLQELREHRIAMGWMRSTINKAINRVKLCFSWAASQELLRPEVAMGLRMVSGLKRGRSVAREKDPVTPVADEHIDAVLPHLAPVVVDAIKVMRLTGGRPSEILTMTADQIDRTTDPTVWRYSPGQHKSEHRGNGRVIPIGPRAQQIIRPRIARAAGAPFFEITLSALRRAILRACKKARIPRFAPNQIRHRYGTDVRASDGLEAAQVMLGHARADVTQTYAERDMRLAVGIAKRIG